MPFAFWVVRWEGLEFSFWGIGVCFDVFGDGYGGLWASSYGENGVSRSGNFPGRAA